MTRVTISSKIIIPVGDSDFLTVEAAGGILRFLWGESLCMERLLALTDGELKISLDRLGIEIGLLDSPGATVDLGLGLTSPPVEEELKIVYLSNDLETIDALFCVRNFKICFYFVPFANLSSIKGIQDKNSIA